MLVWVRGLQAKHLNADRVLGLKRPQNTRYEFEKFQLSDFDSQYGAPRLPLRVDIWEVNRTPKSKTELDGETGTSLVRYRVANDTSLFKHSARCVTFLWVIDPKGAVLLSVEELAQMPDGTEVTGYPRRRDYPVHPSEEKKLGHPSLVDGREARVGGELFLDEVDGSLRWFVNVNSGRYCKDAPPTAQQINNILTRFRHLVEPELELDDISAA